MDNNTDSSSPPTSVNSVKKVNVVSDGPSYALNGKIMLCTVVVLFVAVVLILGFHTYARCLFRRRRRRRSSSGRLPLHRASPAGAGAPHAGGLDVSVLKSLPTFTVSGDRRPDNLGDCPVCLSEFEEGETGRALPKCGHAFHVECIDMWFQTHSSCPLCRAAVQARPDPNPSSPEPDNNNGINLGLSNDSPAELVGVVVEAPPSMEERFRGSTEEPGSGSDRENRSKPPGKPGLSMKRIWSV